MATKKIVKKTKAAAKKKTLASPAKRKTAQKHQKKAAPKKQAPQKQAPQKTASKKEAPKKKKKKKASQTSLYDRLLANGRTLHVVDPPVGFELTVPMGCAMGFELPASLGGDDALFAFVKNKSAVDALAKKLTRALPKKPSAQAEALLWLAYPKGTGALKTDISRDKGWDAMKALGYEGVALVAVDDDWSAFRLRHQSLTTRRA